MFAVMTIMLSLFLYFTVVNGLLDSINSGIPDNSIGTIMQDIFQLQRDISDLKQRNAALEKEVATLKSKETSVAFLAYLTVNIVNPTVGQTLVLTKTELNEGNAYDSAHGIFVAPVSGTYQFAFVAAVPHNPKHMLHLYLKKNGSNEMFLLFDYNTQFWLQRSASQVLHLIKGDRIWIEVGAISGEITIAGQWSDHRYHTHFSGFLIHAD